MNDWDCRRIAVDEIGSVETDQWCCQRGKLELERCNPHYTSEEVVVVVLAGLHCEEDTGRLWEFDMAIDHACEGVVAGDLPELVESELVVA